MSNEHQAMSIEQQGIDANWYVIMKFGKLTLITGPMWSGKTTELLRQYDRKVHANVNCLLVKHTIDARYDTGHVVTHKNTYGLTTKGQAVVYSTIIDLINGEGLMRTSPDTVFIDEIQFFPDKLLCLDLLNVGINVVVAGLNGDYKQRMFQDMDRLFASASHIIMLTAVCGICRKEDAPFSCKLHAHVNASAYDVGGAEKYVPMCLGCMTKTKADHRAP